MFSIVCLALGPAWVVAAGDEPASTPADPGAAVRAVFVARCAGCHGPDLPKPRGRFGYVLDLGRLAGSPELVVPGRPDESELWALVQHGDMPPPDSPHGPLSAAEKETVRAWIAAGAPDAALIVPAGPDAVPLEASPVVSHAISRLGKLHLLALHFPIALVLAAGVAEFRAVWRRERTPAATVQFCLGLAAVAAVPTVALGWLHAAAGNGIGNPQLLLAHRWLGTAVGVWLVVTAVAAQLDARRGTRTVRVRVLLAVCVFLTVVAAHLGGLLAHGLDYFD